jgi:uncharacterized membrane protein
VLSAAGLAFLGRLATQPLGRIVSAAMGIRTTMESALTVGRQGDGERAGRRSSGHGLVVGALTAVVAAGYCVFALAQFYTFRDAADDLVIFDQAVRSYAHFKPGVSIFIGLHLGFGPDFSVLGNHFSPILAVLAPLYWIYSSPATLLVAQAVLFALAIPWIWIFTRRAFGGGRKAVIAAYLVAVAYALSWPIASALAFNFHEVAFAPLLTAIALERLQVGKLRSALIALAVLLLVKEDMGLFLAGIGLYLAVGRPRTVSRQWLVGCILIVVGVTYTWIASDVLIPAMGGRANFYWQYDALGPNVPQAAWHLITHPSSLDLLITPRVKLYTMLWLFGAFCFLPLRSPITLATVPLLLERMLGSVSANWWVTGFQYNAYLVVVLVLAAVDGAARLDRTAVRAVLARAAGRSRRAASGPGSADTAGGRAADGTAAAAGDTSGGTAAGDRPPDPPQERAAALRGAGTVALVCAAAMCAVAVFLVPRFAFGPALHLSFYHRDGQMRAVAQADALVPSGVTVAAVNSAGSLLSARDTVVLWDGDGGTPPLLAPWVVANIRQLQFSFPNVAAQKARIAYLERNGYQVVFQRRGYVVLHRVGSRQP